MKLTNERKIGLSMAVFLAHDDYDYDPRVNSISATSLIKSTRQAILSKRAAKVASMDISQLAASTLGTAVHDAIEKSWLNGNYKRAMRKLGYSEKAINRIVVNPGYKEDPPASGNWVKDPNAPPLAPNAVPVYMEIRSEKEVDGFMVTGKFDFVGDGELEDHKTTGVFAYMNQKTEKWRLQESIYRWLNPGIITSDRGLINFIFTDWSKLRFIIEKDKGYPPFKMMTVPLTLMPVEEVDQWVRGRVRELKAFLNKDESALPHCSPEDLWQEATVYKYYKNPQSKERSTKNYDNFAEAQMRLMNDGNIGVVDIVKGKAKACLYCPALQICSQAKQLVADGLLDADLEDAI